MTKETLTVDYINTEVKNNANEFIDFCENNYRNQIYEIVKNVKNSNGAIHFVLIAGPSSSGKTTSSKILANMLKAEGYTALAISLDDFFVERHETPMWDDGEYNYETADAIDWVLFSKCMKGLLDGNPVFLPTYNFATGHKEFFGETIMKEKTIFVVEGLHALNPIIDNYIPKRKSFKVYIETNSDIKLNNELYIENDSVRLYRRIIRDLFTRSTSVEKTLYLWRKVIIGESLYIDPFIDTADFTVNTFHPYELCVYKTLFCELKSSSSLLEEFEKKLMVFENLQKTVVPKNSVLQEFIPQN